MLQTQTEIIHYNQTREITFMSEETANTLTNQDPNLLTETPADLPNFNSDSTIITILALAYFCRVLLKGISEIITNFQK
ncbi:MAG: hypothetical protein WA999_15245 [Spirulinaceae cyanobacterium]